MIDWVLDCAIEERAIEFCWMMSCRMDEEVWGGGRVCLCAFSRSTLDAQITAALGPKAEPQTKTISRPISV